MMLNAFQSLGSERETIKIVPKLWCIIPSKQYQEWKDSLLRPSYFKNFMKHYFITHLNLFSFDTSCCNGLLKCCPCHFKNYFLVTGTLLSCQYQDIYDWNDHFINHGSHGCILKTIVYGGWGWVWPTSELICIDFHSIAFEAAIFQGLHFALQLRLFKALNHGTWL